uniref:Tc1-like transposase DDE domain-containing protein n=1 Tax=Eptatretus burgeri TaxID=7764 RepID=A0A8C4WX14_EPTBU
MFTKFIKIIFPSSIPPIILILSGKGVEQLPWPARSPDMNPIEHAWDALSRAFNDRDNLPQTLHELAQALTDEWGALPTDIINNLVDSMPRRLDALIHINCTRFFFIYW